MILNWGFFFNLNLCLRFLYFLFFLLSYKIVKCMVLSKHVFIVYNKHVTLSQIHFSLCSWLLIQDTVFKCNMYKRLISEKKIYNSTLLTLWFRNFLQFHEYEKTKMWILLQNLCICCINLKKFTIMFYKIYHIPIVNALVRSKM